MKKVFLTVAAFFFAFTLFAQDTVSFFNEPDEDSFMRKVEGKIFSKMNKGWYAEPFFGFAFVAGGMEDSQAEISYGKSYTIDFGAKWRYQVSQLYSVTVGTYFLHNRYRIIKGMENNILHISDSVLQGQTIQTERFRTWGLAVSIGNRFNFDTKRRHEKLGKYFEISAYGSYNYSRDYEVDYYGGSEIEAQLTYKDPILFNPFEAGLQAHLAWSWFSLSARYRLTNTFNKDYSSSELPRLSLGAVITFGTSKL